MSHNFFGDKRGFDRKELVTQLSKAHNLKIKISLPLMSCYQWFIVTKTNSANEEDIAK